MRSLITGDRAKRQQDVRSAKGPQVAAAGAASDVEVSHAAAVLEESVREITGTAAQSQDAIAIDLSATPAEIHHTAEVLEASAQEAAGIKEPGHLITSLPAPGDGEVAHAAQVLQESVGEVIGSANARGSAAASAQPEPAMRPALSPALPGAFGAFAGLNHGIDALLQGVAAFSRVADEARTDFAAAAKRRTDRNMDMITRLAACRSLPELAAAQGDAMREHLALTISEVQQLTARSLQISASALHLARPQSLSLR